MVSACICDSPSGPSISRVRQACDLPFSPSRSNLSQRRIIWFEFDSTMNMSIPPSSLFIFQSVMASTYDCRASFDQISPHDLKMLPAFEHYQNPKFPDQSIHESCQHEPFIYLDCLEKSIVGSLDADTPQIVGCPQWGNIIFALGRVAFQPRSDLWELSYILLTHACFQYRPYWLLHPQVWNKVAFQPARRTCHLHRDLATFAISPIRGHAFMFTWIQQVASAVLSKANLSLAYWTSSQANNEMINHKRGSWNHKI